MAESKDDAIHYSKQSDQTQLFTTHPVGLGHVKMYILEGRMVRSLVIPILRGNTVTCLFNPFMPSGFFYFNSLDRFISYIGVSG